MDRPGGRHRKKDPNMVNRLLSVLAALAFALVPVAAQSQSQPQSKPPSQPQPPAKAQQQTQGGGFLYKSTMPDGRVIYGDAPTPGAVKVEQTKPDTSKKGITAATPNETAALRRMEGERSTRTGGSSEREAQLEGALKKMEAGREAAREPREGERIGTAGGGGRFTDSYLERQKKYEEDIKTLQTELEKARSAR
jgi:hypothetical protein